MEILEIELKRSAELTDIQMKESIKAIN